MRTIFVTGSDTGIGKTRVAAAVARLLAKAGLRMQLVKPVETGSAPAEAGDAAESAKLSGLPKTETFTLFRFREPLAPLAAAERAGEPFSFPLLLDRWQKLPSADLRIVEGAGGIAVPLDPDGRDWSNFAREIAADRTILVTADRLGAINQARLALAYALAKNLRAGIWLNETSPQSPEIRESNRRSLADSVWATQHFSKLDPETPDKTRRHLSS